MIKYILENSIESELFSEHSFYGKLSDYGIWDADEFWNLHKELILLSYRLKVNQAIESDVLAKVISIYVNISNLIISSVNCNDGFFISNIDISELIAFKERLDLAVVGIFSGDVISESSFDLVNPLLT